MQQKITLHIAKLPGVTETLFYAHSCHEAFQMSVQPFTVHSDVKTVQDANVGRKATNVTAATVEK